MGKSLSYREMLERWLLGICASLHFVLEVGNAGRQHGQS